MLRRQDIAKNARLGLLGACSLALLAGCGWFSSDPVPKGKARPGADRQVAPTGTLPPPAPGHRLEQGVVPADETRGGTERIGSVVATKGGQRAQKEAADKDAAERDAKAREARDAAAKAKAVTNAEQPVAAPPAASEPAEPVAPRQ